MPKSFILYSALARLTDQHVLVCAERRKFVIFVRAELVNCHYNDAMDRVKPMEGETFLNCVPAGE